tara:strand:- start:1818 stop:2057 length:240 start_codon:yes stop_codon:yes gene_type:complete
MIDIDKLKFALVPYTEVTERMLGECNNSPIEALRKAYSDSETLVLLTYHGNKPYSLYGRDVMTLQEITDLQRSDQYTWS